MIDAAARGAWDVLVDKLGAFIARRVPAGDADDVVQDVLLKIHRGGGGVDDARFAPWVYAVARNAIADYYRARAKRSSAPVDDDVRAPDVDEERALLGCVAPFVTRLASPYREAVTLVELEGLTQQAAADVAGVSLSGMKSRVQRGRRMLRALFEECCALTIDARGRAVTADSRCGCDAGGCDADRDGR